MADAHWWEWDQPQGSWPAREMGSSTFREVVAGRAQCFSRQKTPPAWQQTHLVQVLKKREKWLQSHLWSGLFSLLSELFVLLWSKIYIPGTITFTLCISQTTHKVFVFFHVGSKPFPPFFSSSLESSLFKYRIFPCVCCSTWFWCMLESINWEEKKKITPEPLLREGVINDFRLIENVCSKSSNWAPFWLTAFSQTL